MDYAVTLDMEATERLIQRILQDVTIQEIFSGNEDILEREFANLKSMGIKTVKLGPQ